LIHLKFSKKNLNDLAELIKNSKNIVILTGAGISTAAKIPDFRGPKGVWTLRDKGESVNLEVTIEEAQPTLTHMGLVSLQNWNHFESFYIVSQNVDGLHRRSGILAENLSELHGNCYLEKCSKCGEEYFRDYDVCSHRATIDISQRLPHATGRICEDTTCAGMLIDSIISFGEALPKIPLSLAKQRCSKADLVISIGTSLLVSPACDLPANSLINGGKFVIWNLQKTPMDNKAMILIHEKCEKGFPLLLQKLGL